MLHCLMRSAGFLHGAASKGTRAAGAAEDHAPMPGSWGHARRRAMRKG